MISLFSGREDLGMADISASFREACQLGQETQVYSLPQGHRLYALALVHNGR